MESMKYLGILAGLELAKVVFDSTAFQFWGSEQYRKGIALAGGFTAFGFIGSPLPMWLFQDAYMKSIEEMGELIVELAHHLEKRDNVREVAEEIADVSIMISQLKIIFDAKMIEEYQRQKIERLKERVAKEKT